MLCINELCKLCMYGESNFKNKKLYYIRNEIINCKNCKKRKYVVFLI